jgi:hypothetical protein
MNLGLILYPLCGFVTPIFLSCCFYSSFLFFFLPVTRTLYVLVSWKPVEPERICFGVSGFRWFRLEARRRLMGILLRLCDEMCWPSSTQGTAVMLLFFLEKAVYDDT